MVIVKSEIRPLLKNLLENLNETVRIALQKIEVKID